MLRSRVPHRSQDPLVLAIQTLPFFRPVDVAGDEPRLKQLKVLRLIFYNLPLTQALTGCVLTQALTGCVTSLSLGQTRREGRTDVESRFIVELCTSLHVCCHGAGRLFSRPIC
ncbi:hypothetical protein HaLaN_12542 [Haematococcus lacustris]|uniref:Uncharacterized protein n=1 Tax=Haematococcus lacustris TaxID=44745 RepID=A0A699Z2A9_HAELA|nr:hypothetical protein HaLaN_12542 [Haematococcus lacustris]